MVDLGCELGGPLLARRALRPRRDRRPGAERPGRLREAQLRRPARGGLSGRAARPQDALHRGERNALIFSGIGLADVAAAIAVYEIGARPGHLGGSSALDATPGIPMMRSEALVGGPRADRDDLRGGGDAAPRPSRRAVHVPPPPPPPAAAAAAAPPPP